MMIMMMMMNSLLIWKLVLDHCWDAPSVRFQFPDDDDDDDDDEDGNDLFI